MRYNALIVGKPRSGKNTGLEDEVLQWADRLLPIVLLLPHAHDWGPRIAALLLAAGHGIRLFIHRLADCSRVMQFNLLPASQNPDPLQRSIEREDTQMAIRWQLSQKRQIDYERQALIDETLGLLLDLLMAQPQRYRLTDLLKACYPRSRLHRQLREQCTETHIIERLDSMRAGLVSERQTWGAVQRLVHQFLGSVTLQVRDGLESPFESTLQHGAIHIFEGGNNARVTATLFSLVKIEVVNILRNHWNTTGQRFPLLLILDESQGF